MKDGEWVKMTVKLKVFLILCVLNNNQKKYKIQNSTFLIKKNKNTTHFLYFTIQHEQLFTNNFFLY